MFTVITVFSSNGPQWPQLCHYTLNITAVVTTTITAAAAPATPFRSAMIIHRATACKPLIYDLHAYILYRISSTIMSI